MSDAWHLGYTYKIYSEGNSVCENYPTDAVHSWMSLLGTCLPARDAGFLKGEILPEIGGCLFRNFGDRSHAGFVDSNGTLV